MKKPLFESTAQMYEFLATGKDFKKMYKNQKHISNIVNPMGSNYDQILPELGVILEEKGRSKKAQKSMKS